MGHPVRAAGIACLGLLSACGAGGVAPPPSSPRVEVRAISRESTATPAAAAASERPAAAPASVPASVPAGATPAPSAAAAGAIRLGLLAPFSGLAAPFGQDMLRGAQLAVDDVNGSGGIGRSSLAIDQADGKAGAAPAADAAQKLVRDGVVAVVGPATSGAALAAAATLAQARVPMITPAANAPEVTDAAPPGGFVFRATGRWDQEPPLLAGYLLKRPNVKVALISDTSAYAGALAGGLRRELARSGVAPVADDTLAAGNRDFGGAAARLKSQAPAAVFYAGYAAEGGALARALKDAGLSTTLVMGDAAEDRALIAAAGSAAEGLIFAYPPDPAQVAAAAGLREMYRARFGVAASIYAASTYDAVRLVADALRRTGGSGGDELRQALAGTRGFNGAYWGSMAFDGKGDLQAQTYVLWTVQGSRFEQLPTG